MKYLFLIRRAQIERRRKSRSSGRGQETNFAQNCRRCGNCALSIFLEQRRPHPFDTKKSPKSSDEPDHLSGGQPVLAVLHAGGHDREQRHARRSLRVVSRLDTFALPKADCRPNDSLVQLLRSLTANNRQYLRVNCPVSESEQMTGQLAARRRHRIKRR